MVPEVEWCDKALILALVAGTLPVDCGCLDFGVFFLQRAYINTELLGLKLSATSTYWCVSLHRIKAFLEKASL